MVIWYIYMVTMDIYKYKYIYIYTYDYQYYGYIYMVYIYWLVVWNIFDFPFHIWDVILPIDSYFS